MKNLPMVIPQPATQLNIKLTTPYGNSAEQIRYDMAYAIAMVLAAGLPKKHSA